MLGCVILWFESELFSILGISYILRSRLFLIWIFGFIPASCAVHLGVWLLVASVLRRVDGAEDWLNGKGRWRVKDESEGRWWKRLSMGEWVFWWGRVLLKGICLADGFLGAARAAGPQVLDFGDG